MMNARLSGMNDGIWYLVFSICVLMLFGIVSGAEIDDDILDAFGSGEEKVRVIVERDVGVGVRGMRSMSDNFGVEKITERGDFFTAYVSERELEELRLDSRVSEVNKDILLTAFMDDVVGTVGANETWGLEFGDVNLSGVSGSVCILDSGINRTHGDFDGRILDEHCFCSVSGSPGCCPNGSTEDDYADDDEGHGTHVAGIVGASGGINGIAVDVGLVVVKILNGSGLGNYPDLAAGIEWCVDNAATYNISVISASLGNNNNYNSSNQASCDNYRSTITDEINNAFANNISVVIAAGNNGWTTGITWPACISNATPIGAVNKDDSLVYNRGDLLKLLGIGFDVNSTCINGKYCEKDGTSMATPGVAGAIAIINQLLGLMGQTMTPAEVEDVLYNNGKIISESGNDYARINLYDAVLSLDDVSPDVSLVSPSNGSISSSVNQTFICNATDWQLVNVTLRVWNSSGLYRNVSDDLIGEVNETSFNLSNMASGEYWWNCFVVDNQSNVGSASENSSLVIGGIATTLSSPSNRSYTNINETNFSCSVISELDYELSNITFYLWNSSELVYNLSEDVSGFSNSSVFNYTVAEEGDYNWNCLSLNNGSNSSWGDSNFSVIYDVTVPNLTLTSLPSSVTSNSVSRNFGFNVTDDNIANCSLIVNGAVSLTNSSVNVSLEQMFSKTFTPGNYAWNINCSDLAGNVNASGENSFVIMGVVSSSGGSSSGGGGGGNVALEVYDVGVSELSVGYSKNLKAGEKLNFSVSYNEKHLLTVDDIGADYVNLTIESDPINLKLGVGESVKLNLSSDVYYDLFVRIDSVLKNEVGLTIQSINETIDIMVVEEVIEEVNDVDDVEKVSHLWVYWVCVVVLFFGVGYSVLKKFKEGVAVKEYVRTRRSGIRC